MVQLTNGMSVPISVLLGGGGQDNKGRSVKFEQEKDTNLPVYTSKRKDGSVYSFTFPDNAMATITVQQASDLKALRKQGFPVPKEDAKKIDDEIKQEKKEAKEAKKKAREEAKKAGAITEAEAERQEKEEKEQEAEEAEAEAESGASGEAEEKPTLTGADRSRPKGR